MVKKLNITHEIVIKKTEIIRLENEISERFTRPFSIYTQVGIFCVGNGGQALQRCKTTHVFTSNLAGTCGLLWGNVSMIPSNLGVSQKMNEPIRSQVRTKTCCSRIFLSHCIKSDAAAAGNHCHFLRNGTPKWLQSKVMRNSIDKLTTRFPG